VNKINKINLLKYILLKLLYKIKMAEIIFIYEGNQIKMQYDKNKKMNEICNELSTKINMNLNSLIFIYEGSQLNLDKKLNEIKKENNINILVFKRENGKEICSKCGRILNNKILDNIILLNNNINTKLLKLKSNIEYIINDLINKKDITLINNQLKNADILINNILNEDINKINNELNKIKNNDYITNIKENKNKLKNEIICIYNKQDNEIDLLHDYNLNLDNYYLNEKEEKSYLEGKSNINGNNIEIYINNEKIKFDYKYKSNEKGDIKVIFKFNKLLNSTSHMFWRCSSLKSIDLSSFNTSKVSDMKLMFFECSSLKSIDLSSFNTSNVTNMSYMFSECSSLASIDLSSFNTSNATDMNCMLYKCSSLKKENIKINESEKKILDNNNFK